MEIAVDDVSPNTEEFRFQTVGEQLKAERERLGLSLSDLGTKTRVPVRHLDAIEQSNFSALPGTTYTLGFARSYASAVGLNSAKINTDLRAELAQGGHEGYKAPAQNYEPADPSRVPSRALAWTAAAVGVVIVAAYLIWRSMTLEGPVPVAPTDATSAQAEAPKTRTVPVAADAPVILTATDNVWVKIYDADNKRLYENEMKPGDSFTVPPSANKPMIVTGRPQSVKVTVGGTEIPSLGSADKTIADVEVSATALLGRNAPATSGSQTIDGSRP